MLTRCSRHHSAKDSGQIILSCDVVVVGAGGSGAPLAARLSERSSRSVLLVEAGRVPRVSTEFPDEFLDAGSLRGADPSHPDNWSFDVSLFPGRHHRIARGRIAGGSTATNAGYFARARRSDFARWHSQGHDEWSWERCLPFMRQLESDIEYPTSPVHGSSGPVPVHRQAQDDVVSIAFAAACEELGYPYVSDMNAQDDFGYGPLPMSVLGGVRWNTALAYLAATRENLRVVENAPVARVLFEGTVAIGVELEDGTRIRAREVVLSAGSIGSPVLLLNSGIGPRPQLERAGIPVVADIDAVGQGFSDHPQVDVQWRRTIRGSSESRLAIASELSVPGIEILPLLAPLETLVYGTSGSDLMSVLVTTAAQARGTIELDEQRRVLVSYNYLEAPADRARIRDGVRLAVTILASPAFADIGSGPLSFESDVASDESLDLWIRQHLSTALHMCGSAAMGRVVDQYGRVMGVENLRVADTSVLPDVPSRGPAATSVLIGERIADFISRGL